MLIPKPAPIHPPKKCEHEISLNLKFIKRLLEGTHGAKFVYDTLKTRLTIHNHLSTGDKEILGKWLLEHLNIDKAIETGNFKVTSDPNNKSEIIGE